MSGKRSVNKNWNYAFLLASVIFMMPAISSCNIFEESEGAFIISTNALPATGGTVIQNGSGTVELLAVANDNWVFTHWSGDVESTENPLQITLTQNTQVSANFALAGNDTRVLLTISDGQFISELEFGQKSGATDGFDTYIDLEAPPPPPDGVLFSWFDGADRPLLYDYRNPFTQNPVWSLRVRPGASQSVNLAWEIDFARDNVTWILSNEDETLQIDLRTVSNLSVNLSQPTLFTITQQTE